MNTPNAIAKEFERRFKKKLKRFYCYELDLLDYGERAFLDCFSRVDIGVSLLKEKCLMEGRLNVSMTLHTLKVEGR